MALSTLNLISHTNGNNDVFQDASYHFKFLLLLANNAKKNNCSLKLISDIKEGDSLDNLLFEFKPKIQKSLKTRFIQAKFSKNQEKFEIDDFELAKYFLLYQKVRDSQEKFEDLVILTNSVLDVVQNAGTNLHKLEEGNDPIYFERCSGVDGIFETMGDPFKIISSGSTYTEERNITFETIERSINLLHPSATIDEIQDFLDKVLLVTNLKEEDMQKCLAKDLDPSYLSQEIYDDRLLQFLDTDRPIQVDSLLDMLQRPKSLVQTDNIFTTSSNFKMNLEAGSLEFKVINKHIHNFLIYERHEFENRILSISTALGETQFASIKVLQAMKLGESFKNDDSFLMINTNISAESFKKAIEVFEADNLVKLLLIECDKMVKNYYKSENELFEILQNNSSKKLIVIAEKYKLEIDPSFHVEPPLEEEEQKASDLTENSLKQLLSRDVRFQGTHVGLGDVIEVENKSLIETLPLRDLISIQKIGESVPVYKKFKEDLFVERKFLRNGAIRDFQNLQESQEKLIVISDVAGSGKSELFNHLAKKLKMEFPGKWIMKFDFLDHCRDFMYAISMELLQKEEDLDNTIHFITDRFLKITNVVEKNIFIESLRNPGKVVLFFDGFDEIPDEYQSVAANLLKILAKTNIEKIFVSTRPEIKAELEYLLDQESYKICPFNEEDQKNFWMKYCMQIKSKFDDLETIVNEKFDKIASSIHNFHEFAATPMITKMIAEYFEETYNPENDIQMHDVYRKFIEKKYRHFMSKSKRDLSNVITKNYEKTLTEFLNEVHRILAFKQVFTEAQLKEIGFEKNPKLFGEEVKQILKCGLIHETKDGLKFIHPSIAQYFVVSYFLENLGKVNVAKFLISQIFVSPEYQMIRLFLNGKLKYKSEFYGRLIRNHFRGNPETDIEESVLIVTIKEKLFENFYFFYDAMFENMNSICFDSKKTMDLQSNLLQHMICYTDNIKQFLDHVKTKFGLYFVKKTVRYRFERNFYQIRALLGQMELGGSSKNPENLVKADVNYSKFLKWIKHNISGPFFIEEIIFSNRMKGWDGVLYLLAKNCFWNSFWIYIEELDFIRKAYDKKYSRHIRSLLTFEHPNSEKSFSTNVIDCILSDPFNKEKYMSLIDVALEEDDIRLSNIFVK